MPKVIASDDFLELLDRLPANLRERTHGKLLLLADNPRHPSLRVKRVTDTKGIWEASVTMGVRITFEWQGDRIILRKIGPHDILKNP